MIRAAIPILLAAAAPALAETAPPLTEIRIVAVTSASQAEGIAAGQHATTRRHTGPVTLVVRETGIGRARLIRLNGRPVTPQSSIRPLCGAAMTAGACRPGETMTGVEITCHFGELPRGSIVTVQDTSANLPAQTLIAEVMIG